MNVKYLRVSSLSQNLDRQVEAFKNYQIDKTFTEKVSAKDTDRPQLNKMLEFVRSGDTIYVHSFDRLARSTKDLLDIIEYLDNKEVKLISIKENLDSSTTTGRLMITMIAAINQFERENLLERQREGIAIAKKAGKYKGSKAIKIDNFDVHYNRYIKREVNKVQLAKELKISRPTLDKLILKHKLEGSI